MALAASCAALAAGARYLYLFDPARGGGYVPCPFRLLTALECPGCGTLRGLHQLLHGHPWAAFKLNPLVVVLLPALVYPALSFAVLAVRGRALPRVFIPHYVIRLMLVAILLFWVVRNVSLYPFKA